MNRSFLFFLFFFSTLYVLSQTYQDQLRAIHSTVVEQKDGKSFYIHTIRKGQTLYMISKAYGVEVNDIINENPEVKNGIKADQKIRIPFPGMNQAEGTKKEEPQSKDESTKKPSQPVVKPNAQLSKDIKKSKTDSVSAVVVPCGYDTLAGRKTCKVVLMLPLYLEEVESMNPETATQEAIDNWNCLKYLQFYEGFHLAVDSLKTRGLHLQLYVYDVGKDSSQTVELLKKPEIKSADLIIGLIFHKNFRIVAGFARENKIPIVNPVSDRTEILRDNEMVFKVSPSRNSQMDCLAGYMSKSMYRAQILIIRNGQYKDKDMADKLKKECLERKLNVILAEGQDNAIGKLSKSKENVVVAFTDDNAYALDLMRRFSELRNDYNLSLVGLPYWEDIEGLETDYLNNLNTHLMAMYFVDYSDAGVKNFVRRFQEHYKSDPEQLAFQGFDVGYYFLSALMKFGKHLPECISEFRLNTAQTSFEFSRTGNNGFENQYWPIYKYENFKLVKVN